MMKRCCITCLALLVSGGCAQLDQRDARALDAIQKELEQANSDRAKAATPRAVEQALMPPVVVELPNDSGKPIEPRFDLAVNNAPAKEVFMSIVAGTRYSMLVHPDVGGSVSVNLKDVTVLEALEALRELYGYEYKQQGSRIFIHPLALQTRVFPVNYLVGIRQGKSDLRVSSGSIRASGGTSSSTTSSSTAAATGVAVESSQVTTTANSDFWSELAETLRAIVGTEGGRGVVVSSQSSIVVVRAMPAELRNVEAYLRAMKLAVERQVILEAKILEVELADGAQTGINWGAFRDHQKRFSVGADPSRFTLGGGTSIDSNDNVNAIPPGLGVSSFGAANTLRTPISVGTAFGQSSTSVLGLAFQTSSFASLITFLETQGSVQVLSSPRVATINNQKAVLKVGTDEFFVTNVTTTNTSSGGTNTSSPTITVQPFFSGIALDVTPQIDEANNIILHIHPSVSEVAERSKDIDLGSSGRFRLPLASSKINETDTIVRVQDNNIVAIGGLMKLSQSDGRSQVPGLGDVPVAGELFKQRSRSFSKRELVILLKPTVVHSDADWNKDLQAVSARMQALSAPRPAESGKNP